MANPICQVEVLGQQPYATAWDYQRRLAAARATEQIPDTLLLLEHPHTYTLGRSGHAEHLLIAESALAGFGAELHHVDRGGDITYHGPGQLVGYPILKLGQPIASNNHLPQADYVGYIRQLEQMLIVAIAEFGVQGEARAGYTGVWLAGVEQPPKKLAAIGVKVTAQGVSMHGFALNVAPNLAYYQHIMGCGLPGVENTSLAAVLGAAPPLSAVQAAIVQAFGQQFGYQMQFSLPSQQSATP